METTRLSKEVVLSPEDNKQLLNLCGHCDEHLPIIEDRFNVNIHRRSYVFHISGAVDEVEKASAALLYLYRAAKTYSLLLPCQIQLLLQSALRENSMEIRVKRHVITARGDNQVHYLKSILQNDINFGIGPAGTGKTYLAVACAVNALEAERVSRIILVRPIVEAGEKLGFLPGDLAQKVHPYLRPLYDALYEMLGFDAVGHLVERGVIELAPLAYMRGRTLNDAFIILDEGQNTTTEQMKMFLTRIGFNSRVVITGDITQIDLNNRRDSGLIHAIDVLNNVKGISFTHFQPSDVVRHPLIQTIVEAYARFDKKTGR